MHHNNLQRSIIIKPVGSFCNIRCDYCFYLEKQQLYEGSPATHRMSTATLKKIIVEMFNCSDIPTFTWHGGEPTLAGLDFFKNVATIQRFHSKGKPYLNAFQTNGILLNEEWADFFKREKYLVGISLDGPEHIHDRYRKDSKGNGTYKRVFENAKLLLSKGVEVNALTTVNNYSARYPKSIYNFLKKTGFTYMQFMPVVENNPQKPEEAAPFSVSEQGYGRFLDKLFNLWIKDFDFKQLKQKTSIRFFDSLIKKSLGMSADHCIFQKECSDYLVVEHNGDMFSCDYLVEADTRLGNLHEIDLNTVFHSTSYAALGKQKSDLGPECLECKWLKQCYGGCVKDRVRDPKDRGHNHFCGSYKYFFERSEGRFKHFAQLYRQNYQK
ncbi:MAG: anaerobic sulfatase maturase [SAR324 cluster bacterium]|uniref:Anaerobic sulfatase maturase n=1 Tax=SAR324 cluster bacterium TaxID=2024889 RepID=A0A2A4T501_9DELT|nr:MAG: anaerobic sulfatase maturase [SAR324 cluster bacterium]